MKEFNVRDMIHDTINSGNWQELVKRKFYVFDGFVNLKCLKEYDLDAYGRVDLLAMGIDQYGNFNIIPIEIKNVQTELSHYSQIARYYSGLLRIFSGETNVIIRPVLITRGFKETDGICFMPSILDSFLHYTFDYMASGVFFECDHTGWCKSHEDRNNMNSIKEQLLSYKQICNTEGI